MIIQGRVLKEESKSINPILQMFSFPVSFIPISLDKIETYKDENIKGMTDLLGNFMFDNLENGSYELRIHDPKLKYQPYSEIIKFNGNEIITRIIKVRKLTL